MRKIVLAISIILITFLPLGSTARGIAHVYGDMLAMDFMKSQFTYEATNVGVNFYSKDKVNLSNTVTASKVALYLEGPFPVPEGTTLEQVVAFHIETIMATSELNKNYPQHNRVADGIGATIVNMNGTNIGILDYQLPELSLTNPSNAMAIFRRAVIVKDNKMYGFTIAINDLSIDEGRIMVLDMLVITALKSGKL